MKVLTKTRPMRVSPPLLWGPSQPSRIRERRTRTLFELCFEMLVTNGNLISIGLFAKLWSSQSAQDWRINFNQW